MSLKAWCLDAFESLSHDALDVFESFGATTDLANAYQTKTQGLVCCSDTHGYGLASFGLGQDAQEYECNNRPIQCLQQKSGLAWFVALTLKVLGLHVGLVGVEPALEDGFLPSGGCLHISRNPGRLLPETCMGLGCNESGKNGTHRVECNNRPGQCTHQRERE